MYTKDCPFSLMDSMDCLSSMQSTIASFYVFELFFSLLATL